MKRGIFLCILSLLFLAACGGSPTPITETAPDITDVPISTNTSQPTEAPTATNSSQPTEVPSTSFVDDFEGSLDPSWDWVNEDPTRWRLTEDSWLEITAANPGFGAGEENNIRMTNALTRPAPQGSFTLTTRVYANPYENFQQAGINVFIDGHNYVSILTAFCQPCLPESGSGFLMEAFKDNQYVSGGMVAERDLALTDVYLRLVYDADAKTVTGFVGRQPDQWQQIGVIEDFPPIQYISLGAANAPSQEGQLENLLAAFAYIEISPGDTPVRSDDPLPSMSTPE
jgi:hypothetical protein